MQVRVRLFATLRETVRTDECWLALGVSARGVDAKTALVAHYPRLNGLIDSARLAVNAEYQPWETLLHDGDELAFIPPVSGG